MIRKIIKKVFGFTMALVMGLSLTGCGSSQTSGDQTGKTTESASGETTNSGSGTSKESGKNLKILWWGSDNRHEATKKALDLYTEKTGITFTSEYSGWDGYWQKLTVLAASNSMPDILQMDAAYIETYVSNNQLADLTNLIDLTDVLTENDISNLSIDGKLYGVPTGSNGTGMVYNSTALKEYGAELPKEAWTWGEMFAWAENAAKVLPDGVYPLSDTSNFYDFYQVYQQSQGGPKVLEEGKLNIDKDMFYTYMETYKKFRDEGVVPKAEESLSFVDFDAVSDGYISGKVLTRNVNVANVATLQSMMPDTEIGVTNSPIGAAGAGWSQSTMFLSVGANSENQQEAADFAKWFISDVDAGKILTTVRGLPVSNTVYEAIEPNLTDGDRLSKKMYDAINNDNVKALPYWNSVPSEWTDWVGEFKSTIESYMLGETSLDDAYNNITELGAQIEASN